MKLLALLACVVCVTARVTYEGYKVIEITPATAAQAQHLRDIPTPRDDDGERMLLDWQPQCFEGTACQAMVAPVLYDGFITHLNEEGIAFLELEQDLQTMFDGEARRIAAFRDAHHDKRALFQDWDQDFHEYAETMEWAKDIAATHPQLVTLVDLGQSFEGRDLVVLRLGLNGTAPGFFFDGGIHAREWLSPATVQYIVNVLVRGFDANDPEIVTLLSTVTWHIMPIFNVDGFEFTWRSNRLWRKTRRPNPGSTCIGTDPNRNADSAFGGPGTSANPCSDTYHGGSAFSEIEVRTVADYVLANNIVGYNNIHTNAQMLLSPWGHTNQLPPDYNDHQTMHTNANNAIRAVNGANYRFGPIYTTIYPAAGGINDFLYNNGVKYAVAWELRGGSFTPPASFIVESGAEIWEGTKVFARAVAAEA